MSLGVVLHGAVAYMQQPMPGLLWAVRDQPWGWRLDALFWYLHGFRIPLFFITAGFFAAMLGHGRGAESLIRHRLVRLALPLLLAMLTILPLVYLVWGWGLTADGIVNWREVWRGDFEEAIVGSRIWGLGHLWFLQYLLAYSLIYAGVLRLGAHCTPPAWTSGLYLSIWRPLPWAFATALFLYLWPEPMLAFHNQFLPDPPGLAYYAIYFVAGLGLYGLRARLDELTRTAGSYLLLSLPLFAFAVFPLLRRLLGGEMLDPLEQGLFALAMGLFCWLSVFGYLGLALRLFRHYSPPARYFSDAAYWVYLIHLPLVALVQITLAHLRSEILLHTGLKFALVVTITFAGSFISHHFIVRRTVIGLLLNGRRAGRVAPLSTASRNS